MERSPKSTYARKSGISDLNLINKIKTAEQSWRKSSGHAFEEIIKSEGHNCLKNTGIDLVLQKELNEMIKADILGNDKRDIDWLKAQIKGSVFDLYATVQSEGKPKCFGCIQCKTSIRDRVTRDREPSMNAMANFFWSIVFVLDGDFLKNQKFIHMVNGGSSEFKENGWHAMYVFWNRLPNGRIYGIDIQMGNFKLHAQEAAKFWLNNRQWMDHTWQSCNPYNNGLQVKERHLRKRSGL